MNHSMNLFFLFSLLLYKIFFFILSARERFEYGVPENLGKDLYSSAGVLLFQSIAV